MSTIASRFTNSDNTKGLMSLLTHLCNTPHHSLLDRLKREIYDSDYLSMEDIDGSFTQLENMMINIPDVAKCLFTDNLIINDLTIASEFIMNAVLTPIQKIDINIADIKTDLIDAINIIDTKLAGKITDIYVNYTYVTKHIGEFKEINELIDKHMYNPRLGVLFLNDNMIASIRDSYVMHMLSVSYIYLYKKYVTELSTELDMMDRFGKDISHCGYNVISSENGETYNVYNSLKKILELLVSFDTSNTFDMTHIFMDERVKEHLITIASSIFSEQDYIVKHVFSGDLYRKINEFPKEYLGEIMEYISSTTFKLYNDEMITSSEFAVPLLDKINKISNNLLKNTLIDNLTSLRIGIELMNVGVAVSRNKIMNAYKIIYDKLGESEMGDVIDVG